jgi:uroporphyrinogen decarboxylase
VRHLEQIVFPRLEAETAAFDADEHARSIVERERGIQKQFGDDLLKTPYGFVRFPSLRYFQYGYENYFMAYLMYPEVMERGFSLEADLFVLQNRAAARAYAEGGLPPYFRLDHDMADSSGTLVDIESLDRLWFPHLARSIEPLVDAGVRLVWHCDGNLMQMVPRLIEVGVRGFQGFQYEDGMDYVKICSMKNRDGEQLLIIGGVSVTTTLPQGTADDVRTQLRWLVENGPRTGLFLGASSSVAPGVPWENLAVFIEGLRYYRENGRSG